MTVNIKGTWTKKTRDRNGLEAVEKDLLDRTRADDTYACVVIVAPHATRWTATDGSEVPTVAVRAIEVMDGDQDDAVRKLLADQFRARTGRTELPMDDDPDEE